MDCHHSDYFTEPQFHAARTFWKGQFERAEAPWNLSRGLLFADKEQPAAIQILLPPDTGKILDHIGRCEDDGRFAVVMAAVALLLSRLTGEKLVVLELPAAKFSAAHERPVLAIAIEPERAVAELMRMIGETLPACTAFGGFPVASFREHLGSSASSDVFIASEELHGAGEGDATYNLTIRFHSTPEPGFVLASPSARLPIWFLREIGERLLRLLTCFATPRETQAAVIESAFEDLAARIGDFNRTERDFGPAATVVELFERCVSERGSDPAIIVGDNSFSYTWLDMQSRRLAAHLQSSYGAGPGMLIASLQDRSEWSVVALLGILRAGAAFLPLNPRLPSERLVDILNESQAAALLLHSSQLELVMGCVELPMFAMDLQVAGLPDTALAASLPRGEDLAYVIYTSGTTGVPKGVMLEHRGLTNTVLDHIERFNVDGRDRYIQFMATSFDGFLLDAFTALGSGAALIIADEETIASPTAFMEAIDRHGATISTLTPSYLQMLDPYRMGKLRLLVAAGEALPTSLARTYAPRLALYNGYGPTEASINTTIHDIAPEELGDTIPIGRPSANKRIYVVDRQGRLVPPGVVGEICIAGTGLARGYLGDPALTFEKFIDNPFMPGTKLYRSGDRGAWTSDGILLFQGRTDSQVKINGLRIDLAEIDRTLHEVCALRASQVLVHETRSGRKELLAFLQPDDGMELVPSLGEYDVYDTFLYEAMATDDVRVAAYRHGLANRVRGKIVLDPGTGSEAVLARHCIAAGAAKVYAVERDDEAARAASETIRQLGLEDHILLIHDDAAGLDRLPEPVEVVVSALAGNIASSDGCIALVSSMKRKLPDDVVFVPGRYVTRIAGFSLPTEVVEAGFSDISKHYLEELFARSGHPFDVRLCLRNMKHDHIFTDAGEAENIDYAGKLDTEEANDIRLEVARNGVLTGFVLWIEAYAGDDLLFDSARPTHHLPIYLPLSFEGLRISSGDSVTIRFMRSLGADGCHPDYTITGEIHRQHKPAKRFAIHSPHRPEAFRNAALYRSLFAENGLPQAGRRPSGIELRKRLAEHLPDYLLPHRLIEIESWPLTAHGKVDSAALIDLANTRTSTEASQAKPEDALETALCTIWAEVLETANVGVEENLFSLGCDSIRVIQAVHLARQQGLQFSAADVSARPTIRSLAAVLRVPTLAAHCDDIPFRSGIELPAGEKRFLPPGTEEAYPATAMQRMMLDAYREDGGRTGAYHCCAIWHFEDPRLDFEILLASLQHLYDCHGSLRTSFIEGTGERILQLVRPRHTLELSICDGLPDDTEGQEIVFRAAMAEDIANRFTADGHAPMVRFRVWRQSPHACAILISFHHALLDGWSGVELRNALVSTYASLKQGMTLGWADPGNPTRQEFSALERRGNENASVADYLEGVAKASLLPGPQSAKHGSGRQTTFSAQIPPFTLHGVQETARRDGVTMKAAFLAALVQGLRETGLLSTPQLGVVVNGRSERLTDPLRATGLFWNIVPVLVGPVDPSPATMQKRLDIVEALGVFPFSAVSRAFRDNPGFPTFNFVNFHNVRSHETVVLREGSVHDRFHFPMNIFVAINGQGVDTSGHWRVEFDTGLYDEDSVAAAVAAANAWLQNISDKLDQRVPS